MLVFCSRSDTSPMCNQCKNVDKQLQMSNKYVLIFTFVLFLSFSPGIDYEYVKIILSNMTTKFPTKIPSSCALTVDVICVTYLDSWISNSHIIISTESVHVPIMVPFSKSCLSILVPFLTILVLPCHCGLPSHFFDRFAEGIPDECDEKGDDNQNSSTLSP